MKYNNKTIKDVITKRCNTGDAKQLLTSTS